MNFPFGKSIYDIARPSRAFTLRAACCLTPCELITDGVCAAVIIEIKKSVCVFTTHIFGRIL